MKNIHVLPTDKIIKNVGDLVKDQYGDTHIFTKNDGKEYGKTTTKLNIYITNDKEIKEGDWFITKGEVFKCTLSDEFIWRNNFDKFPCMKIDCKKIILTTDQDLIKDGVQAIDDEFLEWFVKNPSCEVIQVEKSFHWDNGVYEYEIIIPKEEPKKVLTEEDIFNQRDIDAVTDYIGKETSKQETLEEVECNNCGYLMSLTEDESVYACYNSECTSCYEEYEEEPKMIECYFIPSNNTSSATICGNCGKEKFLHTIGSGIKVSKSVIITQEEPNQEPLEEAACKALGYDYNDWVSLFSKDKSTVIYSEVTNWCKGAKWQQERSYSEEEMLKSFMAGIKCESKNGKNFEQFIKQFKNK
jgi:hypothetical protein